MHAVNTRSDRDSGAILVFTAIVLLVLMGVAAIAVDLGNAWSTRRQAQAASDVGAVGALQEIPRTFATSIPPIAQDEVEALVGSLTNVNSPGSTPNVTISGDFLEVFVDVDAEARNSFSRAIGAGASTTAGARATARVEIPETDKLLPIGAEDPAGRPYQCLRTSLPAYPPPPAPPDPDETPRVCVSVAGATNRLLDMRGLDPLDCATGDAVVVDNIHNGVDHRIDNDQTTARAEADACANGHILTLPNQADRVQLSASSTLLTQAFGGAGSPVATIDDLWTHLLPAPSGIPECWDTNFDDTVLELEQLSRNMRTCLVAWDATKPRIFADSIIGSPRFGFGVDIDADPADPVLFEESALLWFHTIVYNDATLASDPDQDYGQYRTIPSPAPTSDIGGVTFFALQPGMLTQGDEDALLPPYGTDDLEFFVID